MGARTPEHFFAVEELHELKCAIPGFDIRFAADANAIESCYAGYATDFIADLALDPTTRVYVCGPPPMVEAGRKAAAAAGLARNNVLCERFT